MSLLVTCTTGQSALSASFWSIPNQVERLVSWSGAPLRDLTGWWYGLTRISWSSTKVQQNQIPSPALGMENLPEAIWAGCWPVGKQLWRKGPWGSWWTPSWTWANNMPSQQWRPITSWAALARLLPTGPGKWLFPSVCHLSEHIWGAVSSFHLCTIKTLTYWRKATAGYQYDSGTGAYVIWEEAERT